MPTTGRCLRIHRASRCGSVAILRGFWGFVGVLFLGMSYLFYSILKRTIAYAECPKESGPTDAINVYFFAVENLSALRR